MKKKCFIAGIVLAFLVFVLIVRNNKENDGNIMSDAYVFPITVDSLEWAKFTTLDEKLEATQLPIHILESISTDALIQTILKYPLLVNVYAYSTEEKAFEQLFLQFNGIEELCIRDDAGSKLLAAYSNSKDSLHLKALSLLLSSSSIQEKLTINEQKEFHELRKKDEFEF